MKSLDTEMRQEYDEAIEVAPEVVKRETPFIDFLRMENFDPNLAARRLVFYWKYRKQAFQDRWLFPMNQTGSGALSTEDILLLRTGVLVVLSRPAGPIVLCDRSRTDVPLGIAATRLAFYLASSCPGDVTTQNEGIVVLHIVTSASRPPIEIDPSPWKMILEGLPLKLERMIVVQSVEVGKKHLLDYLAYQEARVLQYCSGLPTEQVVGNSTESTLELLAALGVTSEYVPTCLGGLYDYSVFQQWVRTRMSIEDATIANLTQRTQRNILPAVPVAFLTLPPTSAAAKGEDAEEHKEEGEMSSRGEEYHRKRNAMYVRRFYQKQNLVLTTLQEQVYSLQGRNEALRRENERLESMLRDVESIVAQLYGLGRGRL